MVKTAVHAGLVVAGLLALAATGCRTPQSAAFADAERYFAELKGPTYQTSVLALAVSRMFDEAGVQYLIDTMEGGSGIEAETALLCLATIYEVSFDHPSAQLRKLREPIEKAGLLERSVVCADRGSSEAIRHAMAAFVKRPKIEALTPRTVTVSGPDTWEVGGRKIAIRGTSIHMRDPKGPVFSVMVDVSRNPIARVIGLVPESVDLKAVAKYAFDEGHFRRAQEIQVAGQSVKLQDRIDLWIGQKTRDGFSAVQSFEGGYGTGELGVAASKETTDQQADGTRP